MKRKYIHYIVPSMLSFLLSGIYSIVDGLFVGNALGDAGLSAINLAWPLVALLLAFGTGIGMGTSVIMSLRNGEGNTESARKTEHSGFFLMLSASLLLMIILYIVGTPLLKLFGASPDLLPMARTYLNVALLGAFFQIFGTGLLPMIRNHGASVTAMICMITGCLTNIFLDWLLVYRLNTGMGGAAAATVLAQAVNVAMAFFFYYKNQWHISFRPDIFCVKQIIKTGLSPLGLTYLPSISIILMNYQSLHYGDVAALSAYTVLAYILSFMELVMQGISDGSQPLLSFAQGSRNFKELRLYRNWTFTITLTAGLASGLLVMLLRHQIPFLFGVSGQAGTVILSAIPAFAITLVLYGFTKAAVAYFYAIHKVLPSNIMVYGEILLSVSLAVLLPLLWKLTGVWMVLPATQSLLTIMGVAFLRTYRTSR